MTHHIVIPDTQVAPGVPTDHLGWAGRYIVDQFYGKPDIRIIHLGDHADMHSLSSWNTKRQMEGLRYGDDIQAANDGWAKLNAPIIERNARQRRRLGPDACWQPDRHIILGNHEHRIARAVEDDPRLEGALTADDLDYARSGWKVHPFLSVTWLDGVAYSHFFANPMSGRPYSGTMDTRLKNIGHSFTMGHQQTMLSGIRYVAGRQIRGLVAGAFYMHAEEYRGEQGNAAHWRGLLVCHAVENGAYDMMEVSMDYLCRRYEGVGIAQFMLETYGEEYSGGR